MSDDLVDIGAKALCNSSGTGRCKVTCTACQREARAVLAAVEPRIRAAALEEAAKVADAKAEEWWADNTEKNYRAASLEIADAIRKLKDARR